MSQDQVTSSTPASAQFASTLDLVDQVIPFLDRTSLHSVLLASKTLATAVLPRLYRTLPIKPDGPCPLYPSKENVYVDDPERSGSLSDSWSRTPRLSHVRSLAVYTHGMASCPGLRTDRLPALPHLDHIHIAGGEQTLDMGKPCAPFDCPLIQHYAAQATRLTTRKLQPLPALSNLSILTVIIRPCQLPFEARGGSVHLPMTFRPVENISTLEIIIWDERHDHRVDWIHHTVPDMPPQIHSRAKMMAGFAPRFAQKSHGCMYCDQMGCVRYSPNVPLQLAGIAYSATRYSKVKRIGVWNADRSAMDMQWYDSKMDLEEFRSKVKAEMERGMSQRRSAQRSRSRSRSRSGSSTERSEKEGSGRREKETEKAVLSFGDGADWVEKMRAEGREDEMEGEEGYWENLLEDVRAEGVKG